MAQTILQLTKQEWPAARLPLAALVLVCMQTEFREGPLRLHGIDGAVDEARALLDRFRQAGALVVHVARAGDAGDPFDRLTPGGRIMTELSPHAGEVVLETRTPNPFVSTNLERLLKAQGMTDVVFAGCTSHSSLSSAVRYAAEHGFRPTVVASACATRDLPGPGGITLPAQVIHLAAMAALADRHACVVDHAKDIQGVRSERRAG